MEKFIAIKEIKEIISDPNYTLKILNKKLDEYLNFKNLFIPFKLPKKMRKSKIEISQKIQILKNLEQNNEKGKKEEENEEEKKNLRK